LFWQGFVTDGKFWAFSSQGLELRISVGLFLKTSNWHCSCGLSSETKQHKEYCVTERKEEHHDGALIRRAKQGDERAFTTLMKRYEEMVYRFAFHVCRDEEKAAETLQDTFVNVYRKLKQFDGKSKFTTWLFSIVTNNCLMKRRKRKLEAASIPLEAPAGFRDDPLMDQAGNIVQTIPSWNSTPLHSVMNSELRERLDAAISRLPMEYRIVFVLRDVEDRSAEETAKILKLSVPAVKSRLRRARVFLREQLNDYMTA
jgi:RNA polymerase sigma-70 factor (ECF subfamily)